jgi:EAL domain-containing protein (putative c-di-GMP-specific phosphodiesterase class I)
MDKTNYPEKDGPQIINIREVIDGEWLEAHFQPVISLKNRSIVALEGLIRGIHPQNRSTIPPVCLFHEADAQDLVVELDHLCRTKVMGAFEAMSGHHLDVLLSVNLAGAVLAQGEEGLKRLKDQVKEMGLHPKNIIIEIIESRVKDLDKLEYLIEIYRDHGFLIALDDVGVGHSNLNRIPTLKPDIIKIDRCLVCGIHRDFYKQEVVKSLVNMGRRLHTLVVAEGAETLEEVQCLVDMDVDMIQGFYFAKPQNPGDLKPADVLEKMEGLEGAIKQKHINRAGFQRERMGRYYTVQMEIQVKLGPAAPDQFAAKLKKMLPSYPGVECLYVLDENGIQISECVCSTHGTERRKSVLFKPSPPGTDHGMREYYFLLMDAGLNKTSCLSEPYLSMNTGKTCVTLSSRFRNINQKRYILCLDINHQYLESDQTD